MNVSHQTKNISDSRGRLRPRKLRNLLLQSHHLLKKENWEAVTGKDRKLLKEALLNSLKS